MKRARLVFAAAVAFGAAGPAAAAEVTLDYDYYRARVEPIFMAKREGHARCYVCHAGANNAFRLLPPTGPDHKWTDAESRKNFQVASALVTPGAPDKSHLLTYPLAPEAGGYIYHSGGRQFMTKNEPEWQTLAAWVKGARLKN